MRSQNNSKAIILLLLIFFFFKTGDSFGDHTILFLGDSLTEGYGIKKSKAFPSLIQEKLKSENLKNIKIINSGESGSKSSSALSRLKWQMRSRPTILVLALGANDGLRGVDPLVIKENLKKTIEYCLSKNVKLLFVGMKMPLNYGSDYRKKYEKLFEDLAGDYKDKLTFLPFLLEDVGGNKKYTLPDGVHPNEEGHELIAARVLKYLRPLIK